MVSTLEKAALFVDGANMHAAAENLLFKIDWNAVLKWMDDNFEYMLRAYYYTAILEENNTQARIRPLLDHLEYNGYKLVTKTAKVFVDQFDRRRIKGNMDIEMAVDALRIAPQVDNIVLMTGDGDFKYLVEALQQTNVKVTVISTIKSNPPMIADELRRVADKFIDLADIRKAIERK